MLRVLDRPSEIVRRTPEKPPDIDPRTAAALVLGLQHEIGNHAVARMLARVPNGFGPAVIYSDWKDEIGERGIRTSLETYLYDNRNHSDRRFTIEEEFEAAIDIDAAYLQDQQDASKLEIWQKQLDTEFRAVRTSMAAAKWSDAVRHLTTAYGRAMAIYALPMTQPQYDVTWKKQVRPDGDIVMRHAGPRMEALFEVRPAGSPRVERKNLNVSLRRHWWNGIDAESLPDAANSLMGPEIDLAAIRADVHEVARQYVVHVSNRGYGGEFGVDAPSGVHYHVNRLDNQQPHCFPNRGTSTLSLTRLEFTAAVSLKRFSQAYERNHDPPVSLAIVRRDLRAADGIIEKLKLLGVGFSERLLKQVT
jgi:hypothetical protein